MRRLPRPLENLARMLTYILCHRPDEFGLVLDEEGFIPLKQLLAALAGEPGWTHVRRQQVEQVAALWQPPAFEIAGDRIRGLVPGPAQLRRPPGEAPPALLHVGIPPKAHAAVAERGLKPPPGKELVLAGDPQTALKLARRRSPERGGLPGLRRRPVSGPGHPPGVSAATPCRPGAGEAQTQGQAG